MKKFPVNQPLINGREKELLMECVDSGWISSDGPFVSEFENKFSSFVNCDHGVAVCNGTAALEAAVYAIRIEEGDEVIMPSFTIISCAIAVIRSGGIPVLVDIEPKTWNMDVSQIESKISKRTKAIMAVHMYGHPSDMDTIMDIAKKYNLIVIEDASQVHGANVNGAPCGSIGDIATFSFYANKIITTGEGGMVTTSNNEYAERAKSYRNLCFRPEQRFYHTELGLNLRMTNMQGAIGLAQLERSEEFVNIKRDIGKKYSEKLSKINGLKIQEEEPWAKMVYWMYCIQLDESHEKEASEVMSKLAKKGVGTRPFFLGMHLQPILKSMGLFEGEDYPITEKAYRYGFYLPSSLNLSDSDISLIVSRLSEALS